MSKNMSYRDKLLELSSIYKISEIKIYKKNKKYLTTSQIIHILKKNKVPIPNEINKNIIQIHKKKFTGPIYNLGNLITSFITTIIKEIISQLNNIKKTIKKIIFYTISFFINSIKWINSTTVNILNNAYNFKVQEQRANKVVSKLVTLIIVITVTFIGIQLKNTIIELRSLEAKLESKPIIQKEQDKELKTKESHNELKISKKSPLPQKKAEAKKEDKANESTKKQQKKIVKLPNESTKKEKNKSSDFILPDFNLKTQTVLNLFTEVKYDLKTVRDKKKVQPIYFTQFPKDLDKISSIKLKKETFIKIVLPLIVAENEKILSDRKKLKKLAVKKMTSDDEKLWLRLKLTEYKVKKGDLKELLKRMDIIPVSIALAQAAKESGWGTSRFALEGNAIFGQWTWNGQGIAPLQRDKEQSHKILRFPILRASVKAYKNNLNTHKGYKKFREKRVKLRKKNVSVIGLALVHTLDSYAETGEEYTKILEQIVLQNSLEDFEGVKLANSGQYNKALNL